MNIEIIDRPRLRAATIRHVGRYDRISEAFEKLGAIAGRAGILGPDTTMIAIYHDDPEATPEAELRSDAAVTIPETAAIPEGLTELVIPAGRYARATHVGPYEALGRTWTLLMGKWLPGSGHRLGDGVCYELYRNNPTNARPQELVTDIYIPLR